MNNLRFETPRTAALTRERARVEELKLIKAQKIASARSMSEQCQDEREAVAAIERFVPQDSPYLGKTLAELADITVERQARVRGRAEDDPAYQLGECRRAAVHRERMTALREVNDRLGAEAGALNELINRCERWLDAKEANL